MIEFFNLLILIINVYICYRLLKLSKEYDNLIDKHIENRFSDMERQELKNVKSIFTYVYK